MREKHKLWLFFSFYGFVLKIVALVCVYSNSCIDIPRVAQRYGTIAAHTWCHASILVVFLMFCLHMYVHVVLPIDKADAIAEVQ